MGSHINFKNFMNDPAGGSGGGRRLGNFPLAPQSSINSRTFDKFSSAVGGIGKDFGSMNMDELLKNIWSAEAKEIQSLGSARGAAQDAVPSVDFPMAPKPSINSWTFGKFPSAMVGIGKDFGSMNMDELLKNIWSAEEEIQSMGSARGAAQDAVPSVDFPLAPKPSINSWTFGKFPSAMVGIVKEFGSTNMDELLKNICSAEAKEIQSMGSARGAAQDAGPSVGHSQKQGTLTLPRTLCQKTVEDIWMDITAGNTVVEEDSSGVGHTSMPQRQTTLGEMTLEEFLVRACVVREDVEFPGKPNTAGIFGGSSRTWNITAVDGYRQAGRRNRGLMGGRLDSSNQIAMESANVNWVIRSGQQPLQPQTQQTRQLQQSQHQFFAKQPALASVPCVSNNGSDGRKYFNLEKVVERRQRRKIKIRESAARSRARKQVLNSPAVSEASVNQPQPEHSSSSSSSSSISQFRKLLRTFTYNEELISMNEPELSANPRNERQIESDPRNDLSSDQMEVDLQLGLSLMPHTTTVKVTMGTWKDFSSNLASGEGEEHK